MRFLTLYEGRAIFAVIFALLAVAWALEWAVLIGVGLLLLAFCINFFRDPEREVPQAPDAVVSAADGTVADIMEVDENEFLKTRCLRVGVFLSVFDVHVNRAPIAGIRQTFPGPVSGCAPARVFDQKRGHGLGF